MLFLTCIVAIPLYFLLRFLNNKYFNLIWLTNRRLKIILSLAVILFASYQVYIAFYPTDSFYIDEFESNTKITFPKSGKIIIKGATYPDIHGDYSVSAMILVNETAGLNNYFR